MKTYLNQAYSWLCDKRSHHSAHSDCWRLRFNWHHIKEALVATLDSGDYQFSPLQQYRFPDETISLYSSQDSLVLKMMSLALGHQIAEGRLISPQCYHIKNHGGLKQAVRDTQVALGDYKYVFKSDIKGYYASIDHEKLCHELEMLTRNKHLTTLVHRSLKAPSTWGGLYYDRVKGIPRGSPLSPLLGAIALNQLDQAMGNIKNVFYARYMDDWVVLCKTRYQLRKVIKRTHQVLNKLKLKLHPDKTYLGKIEKGFDFLGYHFKPKHFSVATVTFERALAKLRRLYEQGASKKRLAQYWRRFLQWLGARVLDLIGKSYRTFGCLKEGRKIHVPGGSQGSQPHNLL